MIGVVLAIVLSLIAVATVTTVSGIALYTSLQTKHFVEQWHKDSHEQWLTHDCRLKLTFSSKQLTDLERRFWL